MIESFRRFLAPLFRKGFTATLAAAAIYTAAQAGADIRPVIGTYARLQVKKGETLRHIARREDVNADLLSRVNNLHNGRVRPGQSLTLPTLHILPRQPQNGIVLNIPERQVYIFRGGQAKAVYPVAVGTKDWPTETGEFKLASKVTNPTWKPTKEMVAREDIKDDPVPPGKDNPVGDRWMGWSKKGFGFHSTIAPDSVGKAISHGCVRLYPESARKMFDLVKEGETIYSMYEPITVGRRENKYFLSVFPDIYHRNLLSTARAKAILKKEGLLSRVNMSEVANIIRKQIGYPLALHLRPEAKKRIASTQAKRGNGKAGAHAPKPVPGGGKKKPDSNTLKRGERKQKPAPKETTHASAKQKLAAEKPKGPSQENPSGTAGRRTDGIAPALNAAEISEARTQGALLLDRYRARRLRLVNTVRELAQVEQLSKQGFIVGSDNRSVPVARSLRQALARLANYTSPTRPLVLLALYRPFSANRPEEPHSKGYAADIAAFGGHVIDNRNPSEAVAGVLAVLKTLPPGQYRLGLPKPPNSDPEVLRPPPARVAGWPFFPAPLAEVGQIGSISLVVPKFGADGPFLNSRHAYMPEILRWPNEHGIPLADLADRRLRTAIAACQENGVKVAVAFPDAADHLHLDVATLPAAAE